MIAGIRKGIGRARHDLLQCSRRGDAD